MPSAVIRGISYDPTTRCLFVTFTSGELYAYHEVPPDVHRQFCEAFSKGRYFMKAVRDRYRHTRLPEDAPRPIVYSWSREPHGGGAPGSGSEPARGQAARRRGRGDGRALHRAPSAPPAHLPPLPRGEDQG